MISGKLKLKICIFGPFFMSLTFEVPYLNENCLHFKGSRNSICPPNHLFLLLDTILHELDVLTHCIIELPDL